MPTKNIEFNFPMTLELSDGDPTLVIDIAKPDMAEEILEFNKHNLNPVSPNSDIRKYDAPSPEEEKKRYPFWVEIIRETLASSCSIVAREQNTGRLVAVIYNKMLDPSFKDPWKHPNFPKRLLTEIFQALSDPHDLFQLYKTDKVLDTRFVAVTPDFGRKGLATKLMELSIQLAIQKEAGAIQVEAVSEYIARAAAKLGYTTLTSVDYATFEYDGIKPLAGNVEMLADHPTARFMARRLP